MRSKIGSVCAVVTAGLFVCACFFSCAGEEMPFRMNGVLPQGIAMLPLGIAQGGGARSQVQTPALSAHPSVWAVADAYGWEKGLAALSCGTIALIACLGFTIKISLMNKRQNQRLMMLAEISDEYLYEYDLQSGILLLSGRCKRLLDIDDGDKTGKMTRQDIGKLKMEERAPLLRAMLTPSTQTQMIQTRREDGANGHFRLTRSVLKGRRGKAVYLIGKLTDVTEEQAEKRELLKRAQTDSLTGIYNAGACREMIGRKLEHIEAGGAFLLLDLDLFKAVNDTHGHARGDEVLVMLAQTLRGVFRSTDLVGRLGGDEFCVFMPGPASRKVIETKCRTVQERTRQANMPTVSIGIAIVERRACFDEVYQAADEALYRAKRDGRNQYAFGCPVRKDRAENGQDSCFPDG